MSSMLRSAVQSASNQFIRPSTTSANARNGILARLHEELHPEIISSGTYERFICAVEREDKQAIDDLLIQAMNIDVVALDQLLYALDGYKHEDQEAGYAAESSEVDVGPAMPGQDVKMAVDGNHSRPSHALVAGGDMMEDHTPRDGAGGDDIPASVTIVSQESNGTGKVSEMMDTAPPSSAVWPPAEDHFRSEGEPPLTRQAIIKSMRGLLQRFRTCTLDGEMAPGHSTLGKSTKQATKPVVQGPIQKQSAKKDDDDSPHESEDEQNDGSDKGGNSGSGGSGFPGMQYGSYIADEPGDGLVEWYVDLDPPARKPPSKPATDSDDDEEMDEESEVDPYDIVWEGWAAAVTNDKIAAAQKKRLKEARRMGIHLDTPEAVDTYYALIEFCQFPSTSARIIVAYYEVNNLDVLASYHEEEWDSHFTRWSKVPRFRGQSYRLNVNPLHKERLAVLSWFCHAVKRLRWRPQDVCLQKLRPFHFEDLKTQMKKEAEKKHSAADLSTRDDLPSADKKGPGSSLPHLCIKLMQFLHENYGESGLPLAYVVRESITRPRWKSFMGGPDDDDPRASSKGTVIDFFDFENFDKHMVRLADILTPEANDNVLMSSRPTTRDEYENGKRDKRTAQFKRDEATVLSLLVHVFKDAHSARSYFPTAGAMKNASGRKVYRDIVGNFLGDDYLRKEAQNLKEVLRQAQYNGESRNYNWDTHVAKFLHGITQLTDLRTRLPAGISPMTNEELIICFLESIKETCDNDELKVARTMILQNLKDYPDVASVACKLRMTVTNWGTRGSSGGGGTKRHIASAQGRGGGGGGRGPNPNKRHRGGRGSGGGGSPSGKASWGKMKLTSDKKGVTGQVECMQYPSACFELFNEDQKNELRRLREEKRSRAAAVAQEKKEREDDEFHRRIHAVMEERESKRRSRGRSRSHSRSRSPDRRRGSSRSSSRRDEAFGGRRKDH